MKRRTFFTKLFAVGIAAIASRLRLPGNAASVTPTLPGVPWRAENYMGEVGYHYHLAKDEDGVWQGRCQFSDGERYVYQSDGAKWHKL